jgi:hypothetical protein
LPEGDNAINSYIIDGAVTLEDKKENTVAGLVKLRTCSPNKPIFIYKNELVIETDENGNYLGAKIGTVDHEDSRRAPYVAYAPSTTIILNGGDASNN